MSKRHHITAVDGMIGFIFAGKAIFTLRSVVSAKHYTYRIAKKEGEMLWFVSVLSAPGTERPFKYMCVIRQPDNGCFHWKITSKSKFKDDSPAYVAFDWFLRKVLDENEAGINAQAEFWHEGKCGRCGRPLTDPESIARGIGPICAGA